MKRKVDPRHTKRVQIMKMLFEKNFHKDLSTHSVDVEEILASQQQIDKLIAKNAPAWPIKQIAPVDLATLRLAIWELKFKKKKEPYKAIVNEAVEIAKEYGSQSSPGFVNGVLGSIINAKIKNQKSK